MIKKPFLLIVFAFALTMCGYAQSTDPLPSTIEVSQDTTIVVPVPDEFPAGEGIAAIFAWALRNWDRILGVLSLVLVLLEILVSIIPTKQDLSIFTKIRKLLDNLKLINWLTRNRAQGGGTFKAGSNLTSSE